jgi:DNA modification methylase
MIALPTNPAVHGGTAPVSTKPIHPFAEVFPPMTPAEFAGLRRSIRSRVDAGLKPLINDIVLLNGKTLDGRHRDRACDEEGVSASYVDYDAATLGDPVRWVLSQGVHRNLTESQKAAAAVAIAEAMARPEKGHANLKQRRTGKISGPEGETPVNGEARELAGQLLGVSGRYVFEARKVKEASPELFAQVFAGTMKLPQAKREIHRAAKREVQAKKAATLPASVKDADHFDLYVGDNRKVMPTFTRGAFPLIFIDPQYNIGFDYGQGKKADKLTDADYFDQAGETAREIVELLKPNGSLWVLVPHEWAAEYVVLYKRVLGLTHRGWITWYENFGNNCTETFNRTSRHLLYFTKSKTDRVFNADAFKRLSDRQAIYGDKRANPDGKLWDDVWGVHPKIPRLVDNDPERIPGFPTQLPLKLLTPIVAGCTDPGDRVLDAFNGSGTTGHACMLLGRQYVGIDREAANIDVTRTRLRGALAERFAPQPTFVDKVAQWCADAQAGNADSLHRHLIKTKFGVYADKQRALDKLVHAGQSEAQDGLCRSLEKDMAGIREHFIAGFSKGWGEPAGKVNGVADAIAAFERGDVVLLHRHLMATKYVGYESAVNALASLPPSATNAPHIKRLNDRIAAMRLEFVVTHARRKK